MRHRLLKKYNTMLLLLPVLEVVSIICIVIFGFNNTNEQHFSAYIFAMFFWFSILIEIIVIYLATQTRKRMEHKEYRNKDIVDSAMGVFSFFKNKEAKITDILLFLSAIVTGVTVWMRVNNEWIIIACISSFILTFHCHCIFNGKNYRYLKEFTYYKREKK